MSKDIKHGNYTYKLPVRPTMPLITLATFLQYAHGIRFIDNQILIQVTPMSIGIASNKTFDKVDKIEHEWIMHNEFSNSFQLILDENILTPALKYVNTFDYQISLRDLL